MATNINKTLYKRIKVRDPKTGKMYKKWVARGTKTTNVQKGTNTQLTHDKALNDQILKSQKIQAEKEIKKAEITSRSANTIGITAQAGQAVHDLTGIGKQSQKSMDQVQMNQARKTTTTTADDAVAQSVNGGAQLSGNQRDEDDYDNPWVD